MTTVSPSLRRYKYLFTSLNQSLHQPLKQIKIIIKVDAIRFNYNILFHAQNDPI